MLLGNCYQLIEPLCSGGMAQVYVAADLALERRVAIKRLKPELAADASYRACFSSEARILAGISHAGIVQLCDVDPDAKRPYMVMELIDARRSGGCCHSRSRRRSIICSR